MPLGNQKQKKTLSDAAEARVLKHTGLQRTYDLSPVGVLGVDAGGMIIYANNVSLEYTGIQKKAALGSPLFNLFEDPAPGQLNAGKILRLEGITDQEFKVKSGAGERWVLISSQSYKDAEEKVLTYLFLRNVSRLKKRERLFSYLNQAATELTKARDTPAALDQIAGFIVPEFADWFTIDKIIGKSLELLLLKHADKEKIKWAYSYREKYPPDLNSDIGAALVIKTRKAAFVPVVKEEMIDALITDPVQREEIRKIGLCSVIMVPMIVEDKVMGLLNFISSAPGRVFDETDLEFAENFANLVSLALENTRLNEAATSELILRRQHEDRFRFLADAIPNMLWTSRPSGEVTYYNQQWHSYTGIDGFEALKEKVWEFLHPDDRAKAAVEWPKAMKNGEPTASEHRLMRHDGSYRWHLSRFVPYKNDKGEIELWVGTSTDIHDQKASSMELAAANDQLAALNEELSAANEELASTNEAMVAANEELASANEELAAANEELATTNEELSEAQISLQRSEKLFRSIALNIPKSIVIVVDKDHRYLMVEGDLIEKMGYDRRDYEGKHPADLSPERYEASKHLYERVIAGERFSVERKADTGETYMVHLVPLRNENDEVYAGLMVALDITDIKQADEQSAKLAAIVDSSNDAVISKTLDGIITSWNKAAEEMYGFTEEEMLGQPIYKIVPLHLSDEEANIFLRLAKGEKVEHFETKRLTKDGRVLDVSLTISPVRDAQGNIIGLSKIARDITEKKKEEQRKNDFIGMVSHELKTPLTTINGIIQVACLKLKDSQDTFLSKAMERANVQAKKMTGMINGFLDISRLEAGQMSIDRHIFDLGELLHEIVEENRLIVSTNTLIQTGSGQAQVNADRGKIGSVVSNLINNAVKYSANGTIEIGYQLRGKEVTVHVKDPGIGIKPEHINKIFDRYYRVETEYSKYIAGFGIGLYLSSEIIKMHHGKIWAESETGSGSTFYFSLPLLEQ